MVDTTDAIFDAAYLEGYTGGDKAIVAEVLALFRQQAEGWLPRLDAPDAGWRDMVHTIKGSAKGIGANRLGELAGEAEHADGSHAPAVKAALLEALAAIEGYLGK